MKKILPLFLIVGMLLSISSHQSAVFAQVVTLTPTPTPTTFVTPSPTAIPTIAYTPTPTSSASATTKGGTSTTSTTLPEELPVTGAYDALLLMVLGGMMFIGLAGVVRSKMVDRLEE